MGALGGSSDRTGVREGSYGEVFTQCRVATFQEAVSWSRNGNK